MIRKNSSLFIAAFLLVLCNVVSVLAETSQEIKIGIIIPLTGPGAGVGDIVKSGAELAIRNFKSCDVNADKSCLSSGKRFRLLIEDTASETKNAVAAFNKLYSSDGVRFFLTTISSAAMALKPLAEARKALLFADVAHPEMTKNSHFILRHSNLADQDAESMSEGILKSSPKNVGIFYQEDDWGITYEKTLRKSLENKGVRVSSESKISQDPDIRAPLTRLHLSSIDSIVVVLFGTVAGEAIKKVKQLGFSGEIFASNGFALSPDAMKVAGPYAEGIWYQTYSESLDYNRAYKSIFGKEAPLLGTMSYTDLEILAHAIDRTSSLDPEIVVNYIKSLGHFEGRYEAPRISPKGDIVIETHLKRFSQQNH